MTTETIIVKAIHTFYEKYLCEKLTGKADCKITKQLAEKMQHRSLQLKGITLFCNYKPEDRIVCTIVVKEEGKVMFDVYPDESVVTRDSIVSKGLKSAILEMIYEISGERSDVSKIVLNISEQQVYITYDDGTKYLGRIKTSGVKEFKVI